VSLRALDRKLLRDLWAMRGQGLAIALVVAAGVAMFVMYRSNFESLRRTQRTFYDRQRFADVFASAKRAPLALGSRLAGLPGVAAVELRVVADVTLDVPGQVEPARGRLVSIPAAGRPRLNDLSLSRGRWLEPGRDDEVLVSEAFAEAHRFVPGDRLAAIVNGRRRELTIAGIALSPEYVYTIPPGEMIPDDRRYGILWMAQAALASAFRMEGGFNDAVFALAPGASAREVISRIDTLLAPYGGPGAIPRALQFSHWTLENELKQLENFGLLIPAIFFAVAAFILNLALTRTLALQRSQIAALKALGYANRAIAWHYLKWALLIALAGAALGLAGGAAMGAWITGIYRDYFRFPELDYRLSLAVAGGATAVALAAGGLGALSAVRRAVAVPPAEAMRPEPPARFRTSLAERVLGRRLLSHASRMVLRNLERQPWRALASVIGIACATAILVVGLGFLDAMEKLMASQFESITRQDVTVSFVEPVSARALHELATLPGVLAVEPLRSVPVRARHGHRERTLALTGLVEEPRLNRVVDRRDRVRTLPRDGLLIGRKLAEVLGVVPGDRLRLEVLEGARPVFELPVADTVDEYLGLGLYLEIGAVHRLLREGGSLSGAALSVDFAALPALLARLKRTPRVAGVGLTAAAYASFRRIFAEHMGVQIATNVLFAAVIAFGVVYNAARISLSERARELASLRVLGFSIAEISLILLGEIATLTLLAVPLGILLGVGLASWIVAAIETELYRFPVTLTPQSLAWSALTVSAATFCSGLVVRRRLDRLDLVAVLKVRE